MIERAEVERRILDEEAMLDEIAGLLEARSELASWPEGARAALALALEDETMSRTEQWKAVVLRRHLFGPDGVVPAQLAAPRAPSAADQRRAERVRASLPAIVRYRAAVYLRR